MALEIEENCTAIKITARKPENGETCSATLERSYSGFGIADADGGAVSVLPMLFSGGAAVDVYFGGEFAFRV